MVRSLALLLLLALVVAGCSGPVASNAPSASQGPSPTVARPTTDPATARFSGWSSDLAAILPGIEKLHPEPYHGTSRVDVEAALVDLRAGIAKATDDELMVGVLRTVAMISAAGRDGHTGAFVWGTGDYPVTSLPLRVWLFPEGVGIIDALAPYEGLVGRRIVSIDGRDMGEVLAALDSVIPRDNHATVGLVAPRFLLIPEVLHGLGLILTAGPVTIRTQYAAGVEEDVTIHPIPMATYNEWAGPYGLGLPVREDVPYLARSEEPLWFRVDGGTTLYIQYNRVTILPAAELDALRGALADPAITRAVVDIRHNYGGETYGYARVAEALIAASPELTNGLFLITGRNTFSAASLFAAALTGGTEVIVVGEPMGGAPALYGNSRDFTLPWSGIAITVATEYFETTPGDDRLTIDPALPVPLTFPDFLAGRDAAIEAIQALGD